MRPHDNFSVAQLRAILPGRSALLALRTEEPGDGRYRYHRRRTGGSRESATQGTGSRYHVRLAGARNEPCFENRKDNSHDTSFGGSTMAVADQHIEDRYAIWNGD